MDSIASSASSDALETGTSRGHRLLASILTNDGDNEGVDRLANGRIILGHLQRDLAVANLALRRSQQWLDCLIGESAAVQIAQDQEAQPIFAAIQQLQASSKSDFPEPVNQPLHSMALALSSTFGCSGPTDNSEGRLSYPCLPLRDEWHWFDLIVLVLLMTTCPGAPLADDAPNWFRRLLSAARNYSINHRLAPAPNFFDFLRHTEPPWLWWRPSQWPVGGELPSLLLLPPPSGSPDTQDAMKPGSSRQDLCFVAPRLLFRPTIRTASLTRILKVKELRQATATVWRRLQEAREEAEAICASSDTAPATHPTKRRRTKSSASEDLPRPIYKSVHHDPSLLFIAWSRVEFFECLVAATDVASERIVLTFRLVLVEKTSVTSDVLPGRLTIEAASWSTNRSEKLVWVYQANLDGRLSAWNFLRTAPSDMNCSVSFKEHGNFAEVQVKARSTLAAGTELVASSHAFFGQAVQEGGASRNRFPPILTHSVEEHIGPHRTALEKAVEAEQAAVTTTPAVARDVPATADCDLSTRTARDDDSIEFAMNSWCNMFCKAASVKGPAPAGDDRPEHHVLLAYERCLVADVAFKSLKHESSRDPLSSRPEGISFGVFYLARLVASLILAGRSDGDLEQQAITRLKEHQVAVVDDRVPLWDQVLGCATEMLDAVRSVVQAYAKEPCAGVEEGKEGSAAPPEMLDLILSGLAFFFAVDEQVVPVSVLYQAAVSQALALGALLHNISALSSPSALTSHLEGASALGCRKEQKEGTTEDRFCVLAAIKPYEFFRPLPPPGFEGVGFWRLSRAPAILSVPVPAGRKADLLQGATCHAPVPLPTFSPALTCCLVLVLQPYLNRSHLRRTHLRLATPSTSLSLAHPTPSTRNGQQHGLRWHRLPRKRQERL